MEDERAKKRHEEFKRMTPEDPILKQGEFMIGLRKKRKNKLFNEKRLQNMLFQKDKKMQEEDDEIIERHKDSDCFTGFKNWFSQLMSIEAHSRSNFDLLKIHWMLTLSYIDDWQKEIDSLFSDKTEIDFSTFVKEFVRIIELVNDSPTDVPHFDTLYRILEVFNSICLYNNEFVDKLFYNKDEFVVVISEIFTQICKNYTLEVRRSIDKDMVKAIDRWIIQTISLFNLFAKDNVDKREILIKDAEYLQWLSKLFVENKLAKQPSLWEWWCFSIYTFWQSPPLIEITEFTDIIQSIGDEISVNSQTNEHSFSALLAIIGNSQEKEKIDERVLFVVSHINVLFEIALDIATDPQNSSRLISNSLNIMMKILNEESFEIYIDKLLPQDCFNSLLALISNEKVWTDLLIFLK